MKTTLAGCIGLFRRAAGTRVGSILVLVCGIGAVAGCNSPPSKGQAGMADGAASSAVVAVADTDQAAEPASVALPALDLVFEAGSLVDVDGNTYRTIKVGNQWWMAENLRTTRFRNGEPIPDLPQSAEWIAARQAARCVYGNDPANVAVYGLLYNQAAVNDPRVIAPEGWHVPSDAEWQTLVESLGGAAFAGARLKSGSAGVWLQPNVGAEGAIGFDALPAGLRHADGSFGMLGEHASFWTSTRMAGEGMIRDIYYLYTEVYQCGFSPLSGFSLRCVRD